MKVSAALELAWQLAGQEAIAGDFPEIAPEHFLLALLKFSEIPADQMEKIGVRTDAVKAIMADVEAIGVELVNRSLASASVQQELRAKLGRGKSKYAGGQLHRSAACHIVFDAAGKRAAESGSDTFMAVHLLRALLDAPTDTIRKAVGSCGGQGEGRTQAPSPLLDQHGRDLIRLATAGKLAAREEVRTAEAKALLQMLCQEERRAILVVTASDETVSSVVGAAALMVATGDAPAGLKGRRFLDLTACRLGQRAADGTATLLCKLLDEATTVGPMVLHLPATAFPAPDAENRDWHEFLKGGVSRGRFHGVMRVSVQSVPYVTNDPAWRRLAQVMTIQQKRFDSIPTEL